MISLSGGLKTTGYYAKASRPPDDFGWRGSLTGGFGLKPSTTRLLTRSSLVELKVYVATLSRASHDVMGGGSVSHHRDGAVY